MNSRVTERVLGLESGSAVLDKKPRHQGPTLSVVNHLDKAWLCAGDFD